MRHRGGGNATGANRKRSHNRVASLLTCGKEGHQHGLVRHVKRRRLGTLHSERGVGCQILRQHRSRLGRACRTEGREYDRRLAALEIGLQLKRDRLGSVS